MHFYAIINKKEGDTIMGRNLLLLSGVSFVISALILVFNYFFFHYFTAKGFTKTFHKKAEKPFVSNLIGQLGVHFLFLSLASLLIAFICFPKG